LRETAVSNTNFAKSKDQLNMAVEEITTISPSTNQPLLTRQGLSERDLDTLIINAQSAFKSYRKSHPTLASRQEIVAKALTAINEEQDVLAKELTEQMGRPIAYTAKEITTAVMRGTYLNKIASDFLDQDIPGVEEKGFKRYIRREPVGVVLVIFAWNVRSILGAYLEVFDNMYSTHISSWSTVFYPLSSPATLSL
jgi:acyl-CoA reductase-like NAD-dependent aldehyde dehydrogenase